MCRSLPIAHALLHPEDLGRFIGIPIGEQLHRVLEVSEEDRHLFALAFERALGGEDLLGEVLRSVGIGRCKSRFGCCL
jgi:hypothetical protein